MKEVFENLVKDMDNLYSEQHKEENETIQINKKDKKKKKLGCCK